MAPPSKRRRRNVESSDEDEGPPVPKANSNTLTNYLFSSPTSNNSFRGSSASPSPDKPKNGTFRLPSKGAGRTTRRGPLHKDANGTSPSKSKDGAKIAEKEKHADLKSLFTRQQQIVSKVEKKLLTIDDLMIDPISEEDEISELKTSSASFVSQHAKKRIKHSNEPQATSSNSLSQRFAKPPKPTKQEEKEEDLRPWSERFGPRNLDELAVHKRKVLDVKKWLEDVMAARRPQRVLILKGPAGSGKTTTMRLLAEQLGVELLEWRNPGGNTGLGFVSTSTQFDEFLGRGGKFGALDMDLPDTPSLKAETVPEVGSTNRVIMIEEFPNTFSRSSTALQSWRSTILDYLSTHTPKMPSFGGRSSKEPVKPIVMIISETLFTTTSASADSFTAHRLLGPDILHHPGVTVIEFNAIAPTILSKAMELVVQKEARKSGRRKTPGPLVLKKIGEIGDIRSAISALEFLCLKGDEESDWGSRVSFTKQKKGVKDAITLTQGEEESLELVSRREASLGIFHAVGKVVYNKRNDVVPDHIAEKLPRYLSRCSRPQASEVCVDTLVDETGTDTHTFISALHENYILSCESTGSNDLSTPIDYINECAEYLSQSDLLCSSQDVFFGGRGGYAGKDSGSHFMRQDDITFHVAVRGLLYSLPYPVKRKAVGATKGSDAFKMFYPQSLKLWRAKEEIEQLIDVWGSKHLNGELGLASKNVTDGAEAFRRSKPANGGSWVTQQSQKNEATQKRPDGEQSQELPPMCLGNIAQQELVLERLPYMAHIVRGRKTAVRLKELEKIVLFSGLGGMDEESDTEDGAVASEAWATDKPSEESSPRKKKPGVKAGQGSSVVSQKLVLSDDDIED